MSSVVNTFCFVCGSLVTVAGFMLTSAALMTDASGYDPPAREAAREELRRKRKIVQDLLHLDNEALVINELRYLEVAENSAAWNVALAAWREFRRQRP